MRVGYLLTKSNEQKVFFFSLNRRTLWMPISWNFTDRKNEMFLHRFFLARFLLFYLIILVASKSVKPMPSNHPINNHKSFETLSFSVVSNRHCFFGLGFSFRFSWIAPIFEITWNPTFGSKQCHFDDSLKKIQRKQQQQQQWDCPKVKNGKSANEKICVMN